MGCRGRRTRRLALARFYADLLGWQLRGDEKWATVAPAEGVAYLGFQTSAEYVPPTWPAEPGAQQQMLHLDFEVDDLERASAHALQLGATVVDHQPQQNVRVHLDPAGHPFCLYIGN